MSAYSKDVIREIFNTRSRFFTLVLISILASLTYVGLNSTVDDIKESVNEIVQSNNMYDIRIDAMGYFTDKDEKLLSEISEIESINLYNETIDYDKKILYIENDNLKNRDVVSLINFDNINLLPGFNVIGKGYDLSYPQTTIIKSGIKIEKAFFVAKNMDNKKNVATIILKKNKNYNTFSPEYIEYTNSIKEKINKILANRPYEREEEIGKNINEGISKIHTNLKKINENKKNLVNNRKKITENEKKLLKEKNEFLLAESKILDGYKQIDVNINKVDVEKEKLLESYRKVNDGLSKINSSLDKVQKGLETLNTKEKELLKNEEKLNKNSRFLSENKINEYRNQIEQGKKQIQLEKNKLITVINQKNNLEKNKLEIEKGLEKIDLAKNQILNEKTELINKHKSYKKDYNKNYNDIKNAEDKLKDAKNKISIGHDKLNKTANALKEQKEKLNTQKKFLITPTYVVGTRYDNQAFLALYNNIESTKIMCYLFPTCFFIIGLFINSTTIVRFAEEQRRITGIYKFLGYKTSYVLFKSLIYGIIPTIIGLVIGSTLATFLFPKLIAPTLVVDFISIFKNIKIQFIPKYTITISLVFIISMSFLIFFVIDNQLNEKVVNLLTGKTELVGKRIMLEKTFLFKKLSFSKKILFRNIFKYKARMIMTILGIGACTALIYLGIGLHFSISDITKYQYSHVKKYDAIVYFKYDVTEEQKEDYINKISEFTDVYKLNVQQVSYRNNGLDYHLTHEYLIEGEDEKFLNFKLKDNETAISKKTSRILNLKLNDNIKLTDLYNKDYNLKIDEIFDNYISQFVYTKNSSKKVNTVLVKFKDNKVDTKKLLDSVVFNIQTKHEGQEFFTKQIDSLTKVVVLMIVLGASLSVVVTYNLGNINIIERKRELSTLKVLGYTNIEMNLYIFREIIILVVIAVLFGLYLGRKLLIILSMQFKNSPIELVTKLNYIPFVLSFILSIFFVLIVCVLLIPKVNKINMIEALKASE